MEAFSGASSDAFWGSFGDSDGVSGQPNCFFSDLGGVLTISCFRIPSREGFDWYLEPLLVVSKCISCQHVRLRGHATGGLWR